VTETWERTPLRKYDPSRLPAFPTLLAIYLSGLIGGAVTLFVFRMLLTLTTSLGFRDEAWIVLLPSVVAGMLLPRILEALSGGVIVSHGAAVIAMLAGGVFSFVATMAVTALRIGVPAPLGLVISPVTIPWLLVSFFTLRAVERRSGREGGGAAAGILEMAPVVIPAAAVLALVVLLFTRVHGIQLGANGLRLPGLDSGVRAATTNLERLGVQAQLAQTIAAQEANKEHALLATNISCAKTATNPKILRAPNDEHFNCEVNYTNGARRGWCVAYDAKAAKLTAFYTGTQMCEGKPDAGRLP
jgi:hypothetical protein